MDGCSLNLSISALACALAQGKSNAEINLLGTFFSQLGDSLETIAAANELCCNSDNNDNNLNTP